MIITITTIIIIIIMIIVIVVVVIMIVLIRSLLSGYFLPDIVMAAIIGVTTGWCVGPLIPICGHWLARSSILQFLLHLSVLALALSSQFFPYSKDAPKRLIFQHTFLTAGTEAISILYVEWTADLFGSYFFDTENSFIFTKTENSAKALYQTETVFKKLFVKTICFQITLKWGFLKLFFYNLRKTYPWKFFSENATKQTCKFK